jgi:uncharacterized protein (DUF2252 family)
MSKNTGKALSIGERQRRLVRRRERKMAKSPTNFVRGTPRQFYDWLESGEGRDLPEGPAIWICGDCHFGNLGPIAAPTGDIAIEPRDFDQAVIGNPAHDLVRLALSLATVARGSDLSGLIIAAMLEEIARGYDLALAARPRRAASAHLPEAARLALHKAVGRKWRQLARERIGGASKLIPRGKRFWDPLRSERQAIEVLFREDPVRAMVTSLRGRDDHAPVEVLDAAYWIKGCSSLGGLRFAVLVEIGGDEPDALRHALIDIKQAGPAAAPAQANAPMPASPGARVIEGARHLSPNVGKRMVAGHIDRRPVFARELMPQDLKLEVGGLDPAGARGLASYLAYVVGKAHARQMSEADRQAWRRLIQPRHLRGVQTPSWLWESVISLLARYDRAYLEHCRMLAAERPALEGEQAAA